MSYKKLSTFILVLLLTISLIFVLRKPVFAWFQYSPTAFPELFQQQTSLESPQSPEVNQPSYSHPLLKAESSGLASCWKSGYGAASFSASRPGARYGGYSKRDVHTVAFSPDGKFLATGGLADELKAREVSLKIWNVQKREFAYDLDNSREFDVKSMAFSPTGDFLVVGGVRGEVELWDWKNKQRKTPLDRQLNKHTSIRAIAVSANGRTVASGGIDVSGKNAFLRLWTITNNKLQEGRIIPGTAEVYALAFSPDGTLLAVAGLGKSVDIWSLAEKKWIASFDTGGINVFSVAFSPDGKLIASPGLNTRTTSNYVVKVWSLTNRQLLATLDGHENRVDYITFSPDGAYLLSSDKEAIKLWNVQAEQRIQDVSVQRLKLNPDDNLKRFLSVSFHPSGQMIALGGEEKIVAVLISNQCP